MTMSRHFLVAALFTCVPACIARAEVKPVVEHNSGEQATAEFKFKTVPSPAKDDAAAKAKFTIVEGVKDDNGGDVDKLNDGKLPSEEDQPEQNFFFNAGTEGGRLALDLGSTINIKQVNTYSWHPNTRGPQVYKLYASDGAAKDFSAAPKKGTDPEKAGWKLIATVDTRPHAAEGGGQYGVSIADPAGALGKYRYLLFDISRTESDDEFGNTFYSEIDVVEQK
ncbi:MAG: basic secretory protein [Phycisphaerales bacterium]|nr:basic secretory protein [Phycisphaerales bacterium]